MFPPHFRHISAKKETTHPGRSEWVVSYVTFEIFRLIEFTLRSTVRSDMPNSKQI